MKFVYNLLNVKKYCYSLCTFVCFFLFSCTSCFPLLDWRGQSIIDFSPPLLVSTEVIDEKTVLLTFNEAVEPISSDESYALSSQDNQLTLSMNSPMAAGVEIRKNIALQDRHKNRLDLILSFYGYNPRVPSIVMNEIRLAGSGNKLDVVEFFVTQSGNLAGVTFYKGIPTSYDFFYVFPNVEVKKGDYIVLHIQPEGIASEVDELGAITQSGGKEASATARDFWLKKRDGLSSTNGLICLTRSPGSELLDLFIYSNRTSASDTNYKGFGSATNLLRANWAFEQEAWYFAGDEPTPQECFDPTGTTATRTICRTPLSYDSNKKEDWYIVDSGECSIGSANSTKRYIQ